MTSCMLTIKKTPLEPCDSRGATKTEGTNPKVKGTDQDL
jgi:hypothetical protein